MKKIRVCFTQVENIVLVQVLDMPHEIRGKGEIISTLRRFVRSDNSPQLTPDTLFLRGNNYSSDNVVASCACDSTETARKMIADYTALITDWNQAHADESTAEDSTMSAYEPEVTIAE